MLEVKKLELQKMKIATGKAEMELKILERMEDIDRLKENVKNQEKALEDIEKQITNLKGV